MPEPQQRQGWTASATYTTIHGNAGTLTHWTRPGIESSTSWLLVGFVNHWVTTGTPEVCTVLVKARMIFPVKWVLNCGGKHIFQQFLCHCGGISLTARESFDPANIHTITRTYWQPILGVVRIKFSCRYSNGPEGGGWRSLGMKTIFSGVWAWQVKSYRGEES